jgi:adenine deaminase
MVYMAKVENMTAQGGYTIDTNRTTKEIQMKVVGVFTPQQAEAFHNDYKKHIGSIQASDFTLNVDCTDMKVISQDMIPKLQYSFELYKNSGFKKVKFITNGQVVIKMQINRIARTVGLPNYEVV